MSRVTGELVALVLVGALSGCTGGSGGPDFALDGSPRIPDDEGLVTAVDLESVTLGGDRRYEVDDDLVSFSSLDLSTVPLLFTRGQYVQVGLDGGVVEWLGTIAKPLATEPPRVLYSGEVDSAVDGTITFEDGLVLRLAEGAGGADGAVAGENVQVSIDPEAGVVTEVLR